MQSCQKNIQQIQSSGVSSIHLWSMPCPPLSSPASKILLPLLQAHLCHMHNPYHKSRSNFLAAHQAFLEFVYEFEILYYKCNLGQLHFIRPCIHALTHIIPGHFRLDSLTKLSQLTLEQTIGNLGKEIHLHSDPYANLSQRVIEHAHANALYALAPDLFHAAGKLPSGACNISKNYILLGPHKCHKMDVTILEAFKRFSESYHWRI